MLGKPRGKNNAIPVYVYDPATKKKRYVGSESTLRLATLLEARKMVEFADRSPREHGTKDWLVHGWAQHWLEHHHGPNTTRTEPTTRSSNELSLRRFLKVYGGRKLRTVTLDEAYGWATRRPHEAQVIAAMFNDAFKQGHISGNVFARLSLNRGKGRQDIDPLATHEIERLAHHAQVSLGVYGKEFAQLITFMAWTGMRPGEVCGLEATEVDFSAREIKVWFARRNDGTRVRTKTKRNRTIVLPDQAADALHRLPPRDGAVFRSATGKVLRPASLRDYWLKPRAAFTAELEADHWLHRRLRQDEDDHLVPYELRHFCASYLAAQHCSVEEIAAHLGNTPDVCRVYIHIHETVVRDRLRAAFAANVTTLDEAPARRSRRSA